ELAVCRAQVISCRVARGVVCHRSGEGHVESGGLSALPDLVAPITVDLTGKIDRETHCSWLLRVDDTNLMCDSRTTSLGVMFGSTLGEPHAGAQCSRRIPMCSWTPSHRPGDRARSAFWNSWCSS